MTLKNIDTLIIDLDNTIFDWFALWYASFKPVYDGIASLSDSTIDEVEADIRRVHQEHRTSEFSFLIEELEVLKNIDGNGDRRSQLADAIIKSQQGRDREMRLYDGVYKSLWNIKNKGTKIVAYTESLSFYSAYRLKRFGLDGVIDVLYSPRDHVIPFGTSIDQLRRHPDEFYELQVTEAKHTPEGELKPNPAVLLDIIKSVGSKVENCAYVGDSLFKDVAMARDVGVLDVYAKYGESQRKPEYALLQKVSHWTEEDVQREAEITKSGHTFEPSVVLKESFCEIFMHCNFISFDKEDNSNESGSSQLALETWKKTVDVQQHFNDMEMRIRNYAITIVGALIAAVGFTYQEGLSSTIFGFTFPTGALLVIAAICAWLAFFFLDRFGYHVLLKGSVNHAAKIEAEYADRVPGIGLGTTISEASQDVTFFKFPMNSNRRLNLFYFLGGLMLILLLLTFLFAETIKEAEPEEKATVKQFLDGTTAQVQMLFHTDTFHG